MSSDDVVGTGWGLDPRTRRELRLQSATEALVQRDLARAVLELEELLDEHPDDIEALWSLAEATMELRDHAVAREAWRALDELGVDRTPVHTQRALCAFELADFDEAVTCARRALAIHEDLPEASYILGLALEHLGASRSEVDAAFIRAHRASPLGFPLPLPWSDADVRAAASQALAELSPDIRAFWRDVPIQVEPLPNRHELVAPTPSISPRILAMYAGTPPATLTPTARPTAVRIYARNLAHHEAIEMAVAALADALEQEAADWLPMPEGAYGP